MGASEPFFFKEEMTLSEKIAGMLAPIALSNGARVAGVQYGGKTLRVLVEGARNVHNFAQRSPRDMR